MALHSGARASALASLLLVGACMSGEGTGSNTDLGTGSDHGNTSDNGNGTGGGTGISNAFAVTGLTADQPGLGATNVAPNLINAWGIAAFQGMFWIADEGTGKVSIFDGAGKPSTKPASDSIDLGEGITGVATNDSMAMQINGHDQTTCGPANLIFASVHGQLIGVNTNLNPTGGSVLVDRSDVMASYTGVATVHGPRMAMGSATGDMVKGPVLALAADFHNARVDVFDESFKLLATPMFTVPDLPDGFAPFNVWAWSETVYVTYAKQDADKAEEVTGPGLGFVAAFDVSGKLLWTAKGNELNAPWGMAVVGGAMMPISALVVGNFGDGHLTAIDPATGTILGQLMDAARAPIVIDGLWGIALGTGVQNARPDALYFAAGPDDEAHGMFGVVSLAPPPIAPPPMAPPPPM